MLATREVIDVGRCKVPPTVWGEQPSLYVEEREETSYTRGPGCTPFPLAAVFAAREDIDTAGGDQHPPYKPPNLLHCYVSDPKLPRIHKETMWSEHAHLWKD